MAEILLDRVSKRFPAGGAAVVDASFTIADGEFFILVGPSGCGKSTLLSLIVGLEEPTEGEIRIDGRSMNGVDPKDRNMAMVFQSYALYPHLSVRENVAFPLRIAKRPAEEIDRRVREAADTLEIAELLERMPAELSGGQRQRVAMARAIVREPAAFLLDEPLSNLDARLRAQMRAEIARLQRRLRTTTVYVTHDQTEAMTLGDRIAVLEKGVVQQIGTPRELYDEPANVFVAGFIGSPRMNLLGKGEVIEGVRPEHVSAVTPGEGGDAADEDGTIELVEWSGSEAFAHVAVSRAKELVIAKIDPGESIRAGDRVGLRFSRERMHRFDAANGKRLPNARGS